MKRQGEEGAALLAVLLLVAVMSVVAIGVLDRLRFGVRAAVNARDRAQSEWYALGAEELARVRIARLTRVSLDRTTLAGGWNGEPVTFPIESGLIEVRVQDATACFNLNSVVTGEAGRYVPEPAAIARMNQLLALSGAPAGPAAAVAIAMRIAASGRLLLEPSELREVPGIGAAAYARARPYLCTLPTTEPMPVNVNTVSADRAIVIAAATDGQVASDAIAAAINARPETGWADLTAFWSAAGVPPQSAPPGAAPISLRTGYFQLHARVSQAGGSARLTSLLELEQTGAVRLVSRRWGADE